MSRFFWMYLKRSAWSLDYSGRRSILRRITDRSRRRCLYCYTSFNLPECFAFAEYGYTLKITEKSDVYSFGIVLLEVITGRRAVEPSTSDGLHIVEWVQMMKRSYQPTLEILDPRLRGMPDPFIQEMEQALGVALLCVNRSPPDRPTMKDVVALLLEVKHPLEEYTKISQPLMPKPPPHHHHHLHSAGVHPNIKWDIHSSLQHTCTSLYTPSPKPLHTWLCYEGQGASCTVLYLSCGDIKALDFEP